jgi:hypothetical protein
VEDVAPNLSALVPPRKAKARSFKEGPSGLWLQDCGPNLTAEALAEFFILWQNFLLRCGFLQSARMSCCGLGRQMGSTRLSRLTMPSLWGAPKRERPLRCGARGPLMGVDSSLGSFPRIDVGRQIVLSVEDSRIPRPAHFVMRSRRRFRHSTPIAWVCGVSGGMGMGPKPLGSAAMAPRGRH